MRLKRCVDPGKLAGAARMSTADNGTGKVMDEALRHGQGLVRLASAAQAEQLPLIPDPEIMAEARQALGQEASRIEVLAEARRRGRPKGARNRRTDDFAKFLGQFGQHPAITMMQIQNTPPEMLIEASKQEKVHSFTRAGRPNVVIERMSYEAAQALRVRCAEGLLPYMESKKPVAVDLSLNGDFNLLLPGQNISEADAQRAADGQFVLEAEYLDVDDREGGADA